MVPLPQQRCHLPASRVPRRLLAAHVRRAEEVALSTHGAAPPGELPLANESSTHEFRRQQPPVAAVQEWMEEEHRNTPRLACRRLDPARLPHPLPVGRPLVGSARGALVRGVSSDRLRPQPRRPRDGGHGDGVLPQARPDPLAIPSHSLPVTLAVAAELRGDRTVRAEKGECTPLELAHPCLARHVRPRGSRRLGEVPARMSCELFPTRVAAAAEHPRSVGTTRVSTPIGTKGFQQNQVGSKTTRSLYSAQVSGSYESWVSGRS